jgi:phosphatidylserine decarboxylase
MTSAGDRAFMTLMRLLPKSALSSAVGRATRAPLPPRLHQAAMRLFARRYRVALEEAEGPIEDYPTFARFFARRLKVGARPIDAAPEAVVSPVDGVVSQAGQVERGLCLQAKGIRFPLDRLLGEGRRALDFEGGHFVTLYLSPRDYHRFHAPLAGGVTGYRYLPGQFWPVNARSVRMTDALFAVNERLVTWLETPAGKLAYVAVGATCVARICAAYDAVVTHTGQAEGSQTYARPIPLEKGAEVGLFEMGSTVILIFQRGRVRWAPWLVEGARVQVGQRIGQVEASGVVGGSA